MNAHTHQEHQPDSKILVGTSGYYYEDWKGHFYPENLKKSEYLSYYAQHFNLVEINSTYYRPPTAKSLEKMAQDSKNKVEFALKLHQNMTHSKTAENKDYQDFAQALVPLYDRGVLGSLLAQFPYSFHENQRNKDHLRRLRDFLPDHDIVVEFRNDKWVKQDTFTLLKELSFSFCCVDQPLLKGLMPPLAVATGRTGYVRFHGRNAAKWYEHDNAAQRYDYRYSTEELADWVPKIKKLASLTDKVYCFTNNHFQSKSVDAAQLLLSLLKN